MSTAMNVYIAEGNIEVYLSKLYATRNARERNTLLRLVRDELCCMGLMRQHFENGKRRVSDNRRRLKKQRAIIAVLPAHEQEDDPASSLLTTLELTQAILEEHIDLLNRRRDQSHH